MLKNTCCFFGHRAIRETEALRAQLLKAVEKLIKSENVNTFLFGSKSRFDRLCLELVTEMKERYPHVKRIYVRAEFPDITDDYHAYLMKFYDETYYPEKLIGSGKAVYVERNYEMIRRSRFCVVYYDPSLISDTRKSGTEIALAYAVKQKKEILRFS